MVPEKRKLMVVSGAIAAAFMLPGCAPAGYSNSSLDPGAAQPAANEEKAEATPSAGASAPGDGKEAPQLTDEELTNELSAKEVARMGKTVQDENGWVLYRFDGDKVDPPTSNCDGDCAKVWPPALTDGKPKLNGIDEAKVGTIERKDGTKQITIGDWPVYRYIGDKKPGQWKGQNVGGKWFVVAPDGKKNLTCLPPVSKAVPPPVDGKGGGKEGENKDGEKKDGEKGTENKGNGSGGSSSDYSY